MLSFPKITETLTQSPQCFDEIALEAFQYQIKNNTNYKSYVELLGVDKKMITAIHDIPFLPIQFFKSKKICTGYSASEATQYFASSGTTGNKTSKHYLKIESNYMHACVMGFERIYGLLQDWVILALLPSYLERDNSSLIYMVKKWMEKSNHAENGFFLYDHEKLITTYNNAISENKKVLIIGVSFALLDLAEGKPDLSKAIVMETGGMKGRRKEITREELHAILNDSFKTKTIHSEYGMTELLSQMYAQNEGVFIPPPWMKCLIRNPYDPFSYAKKKQTGGMNIIDLANLESCCFIETQDLGKEIAKGTYQIVGRMDNSDIRGCNLMI